MIDMNNEEFENEYQRISRNTLEKENELASSSDIVDLSNKDKLYNLFVSNNIDPKWILLPMYSFDKDGNALIDKISDNQKVSFKLNKVLSNNENEIIKVYLKPLNKGEEMLQLERAISLNDFLKLINKNEAQLENNSSEFFNSAYVHKLPTLSHSQTEIEEIPVSKMREYIEKYKNEYLKDRIKEEVEKAILRKAKYAEEKNKKLSISKDGLFKLYLDTKLRLDPFDDFVAEFDSEMSKDATANLSTVMTDAMRYVLRKEKENEDGQMFIKRKDGKNIIQYHNNKNVINSLPGEVSPQSIKSIYKGLKKYE